MLHEFCAQSERVIGSQKIMAEYQAVISERMKEMLDSGIYQNTLKDFQEGAIKLASSHPAQVKVRTPEEYLKDAESYDTF